MIASELGITDKAVFVYASRVLKAVRKQSRHSLRSSEMSPATGCLEEDELWTIGMHLG